VKRELQQEKLRLANQKAEETKKEIKNTNQTETLSHVPAVSGIYYRCPIVSEEILDKNTWYEKIEEFFSHQLLDEEIGLSACLVIHSCNNGIERITHCVETLCKYLDNIIKNPTEEKYWKIRMSNKIFQVCND
jgi:UBX domain-containing protein 6